MVGKPTLRIELSVTMEFLRHQQSELVTQMECTTIKVTSELLRSASIKLLRMLGTQT